MRRLDIEPVGPPPTEEALAEGVRRLTPGTRPPYATAAAMVEYARERGLYEGHEPSALAVLLHNHEWERTFEQAFGPPTKTFFEHSIFRLGGQLVLVHRGTPGGQMAAHAVEKLAALGVRRIVALGHAAGIACGTEIGDLVLPEAALSGDGVSKHYTDALWTRPSPELFAALATVLSAYDNSKGFARGYITGATLSTDSFFREPEERVDLCRRAGVIAVESEAAALFAAGRRLGVEVAALAVVSNLVRPGSWRQDYFGRRVTAARLAMVEVAASALASAPR